MGLGGSRNRIEASPMTPRAKKLLTELSDVELAELLEVSGESDSVELKVTVPDTAHRATIDALELDPLEAQIRQVFFFDTPDLKLNRAGVVARARRIQGKAHDSVVKLRPVTPNELSEELRRSPGFVVEVDAMPSGYVCSAALKGAVPRDRVRRVVGGRLEIRKLFSKPQRAFFEAHAPSGLGLDDLAVLGPIFVLKLKSAPKAFDRKLVSEVWLYPDGSRILELSTKCPPSEMFQAAVEARAYLGKRGVDLTGEQQTKTKAALRFFSKQLQAA
jgi:hypothetical protein